MKKAIGGLVAFFLCAGFLPGNSSFSFRINPDENHDPAAILDFRYIKKVVSDMGEVTASPLRWRGGDFLRFGAVAAFTTLAFLNDEGIQGGFQDHRRAHPDMERFFQSATRLGEGPFLLGMMTTLYVGGAALHEPGLKKTALVSLESYAISSAVVTVLKCAVGRGRPFHSEQGESFRPFTLSNSHHSFPSGHSSAAFAVAAAITGQTDDLAVGILSYSLASLVAVSRVYNNKHWTSDVVAGAALGYFVGKMVVRLNRPRAPDALTLSLAPAPSGFSFSLRF